MDPVSFHPANSGSNSAINTPCHKVMATATHRSQTSYSRFVLIHPNARAVEGERLGECRGHVKQRKSLVQGLGTAASKGNRVDPVSSQELALPCCSKGSPAMELKVASRPSNA